MLRNAIDANIGTTVTAILAALASDPDELKNTMQIAMCHLFFNIFGIMIWYPIPFMRKVPIKLAKILGNTTAKYRWFAIFYLIVMFLVFPAVVLSLSLAGWYVILAVGGPLLLLFVFIIVVNVLQGKIPEKMGCLATWDFLPLWMHSLEPLDRLITRGFKNCRQENDQEDALEMAVDEKELPVQNGTHAHSKATLEDWDEGAGGHANAAYNHRL